MKKIVIVSLMLSLIVIAIPTIANAAIYQEGNNQFIKDGKVIMPAVAPYNTTYYLSGRVEKECYLGLVGNGSGSPGFLYADEGFYKTLNKGRVVQIIENWTNPHSSWYTFEYYGNTNSVKEMRYYYTYGSCWDIYKYNKNGTIKSLDVYAGQNLFLEHREYNYIYYNNSTAIKEASRKTVKYVPNKTSIQSEEINNKCFYRNGNVAQDVNTLKIYIDINGKTALTSITETKKIYDINGALNRTVTTRKEYNPTTGKLIIQEVYNKQDKIAKYEYDYDLDLCIIRYGSSLIKTMDASKNILKSVTLPSGKNILADDPWFHNSYASYYKSGNVEEMAYRWASGPNGTGVFNFVEFYDENFYGGGIGRIKSERTTWMSWNGSEWKPVVPDIYCKVTITEYAEYWHNTAAAKIVNTYQQTTTRTVLMRTEEYGINGRLSTTDYSYYHAPGDYWASGNLKSKTLSQVDKYGNIYYEYLNENFYGNNVGRLSRTDKADGSYALYLEYWNNTDQVKIKELYNSEGKIAERDEYGKDGALITRYKYNKNGKLLKEYDSKASNQLIEQQAMLNKLAVIQEASSNFSDKQKYNINGEMADKPITTELVSP